jgi:adenine-specific DNA-methyltransferase
MPLRKQNIPIPKLRRMPERDERRIVSDLQANRIVAREWGASIPDRKRQQAAWSFIRTVIEAYVEELSAITDKTIAISSPAIAMGSKLNAPVEKLARTIGCEAARLPVEHACYQLSATYTALVSDKQRSDLGMYYTPPALSARLLAMVEEGGIDWATASVLDPACGGGAFLLPVARRMREALGDASSATKLKSITDRLRGFEIDPFAAWLTQVWLEVELSDLVGATGHRVPPLVDICDTLRQEPSGKLYDLVIGNPPYGRVSLTPEQRQKFSQSLFGHANLYGVFTDTAVRWTKPNGLIAYVTPTSFLAGQYYKSLRSMLARDAPPVAIDFVEARRGVFEDVLQETMLATYKRAGAVGEVAVHYVELESDQTARVLRAGRCQLPLQTTLPWLVPRVPDHQCLIDRLARMPHRLKDWGYEVSTGPLVWNRFKDQLKTQPGADTYPLIWAESVTSGSFIHRAEKRNHEPFFKVRGPVDHWLKVQTSCVLVQRTTAKEQPRRLIAAELPASFIARHKAVVVENHLNMVRPIKGVTPMVSPAFLAQFLNAAIVDAAFRCISGSVAVSAFEMEALPLPDPETVLRIDQAFTRGAASADIDQEIRTLYLGEQRQ